MKRVLFLSLFLVTSLLYGQEQEPVIFGLVPTSPPVMYLDEHNEPAGFAVELVSRIMEDLDVPYRFQINDFRTTYYDLIEGEVDFYPSLFYTPERSKLLYYSETPMITSWGALFINEKTLFTDITDIKGEKIGVVKEDLNGVNFINFIDQLDISCTIVELDTYEELFRNVRLNRLYGGVTSNHHQLQERGIKQTGVVFHPEPAYCVTSRVNGEKEILDRISDHMDRLKDNPSSYYYSLERKWYHPEKASINPNLKKILILLSALVSLIVVHLFSYNLILRRKIRKQLEEREREQEKRRKVDLKNEFLSSISHELRTPMNIISSLVYLLAQTDLDQNQRDKINQIDKASNLLLDIIKNFLDFNRLERGKIELENRTFSLSSELEEILNLFSNDIRNKGLNFQRIIDRDIPSLLLGDPYRLTQIITNLLNNAVKFSKQGTITFSAELKRAEGKRCYLLFKIRDEGIGMSEEQLEKLFTPFTQADNSISRQYGGSGLGMAICFQLIQLMDGTINVQSVKGEGTLISFVIPFGISESVHMPEEEERSQTHLHSYQGARLLYAEDNPVNREIGRELLRMAELEIETAENGLDALEKMDKSRFDLVLMDIQMPFMDGLTATKKRRAKEQEEHLPRIPIVALSAHFLEEDVKSALDAGMDDYLTKPISINELNGLFDKWLKKYNSSTRTTAITGDGEFPPIPGIDMADVMDRFGGNYELLKDSLNSFINDYALMPAMLISLESQGKKETARERVHTLKGVLGSLGARELFEEANFLENCLRRNNRCPDAIRHFSQDLEGFINRLEGGV
ncbi:MAG: ATP-binding protein [Spirochaetales bacterium]|nr:ATP-binding protein [Spirochaetales bacterium]